MNPVEDEVARRLEARGVAASREQRGQLARYLAVLRQWNARLNLTSVDVGDNALDRLIVEPALAAPLIAPGATHVLDIGSGGGSPAIPLKIMRPELRLTMVEVRQRKSVFLREVARSLALSDTWVETARFEDVLASGRVGRVDTISIRAVRMEATALELCATALPTGGQVLWFLSHSQETEPLLTAAFSVSRHAMVQESASELLILTKA